MIVFFFFSFLLYAETIVTLKGVVRGSWICKFSLYVYVCVCMYMYIHTRPDTGHFKMTFLNTDTTFPFIIPLFHVESSFFCLVQNRVKCKSAQEQVTMRSAAELIKAPLGGGVASENSPCAGWKSVLDVAECQVACSLMSPAVRSLLRINSPMRINSPNRLLFYLQANKGLFLFCCI